MDSMGARIDALIIALEIKRSSFAATLNVSPAFITRLCSGVSQPSDRTIYDICREFRVNEEWLRTGKGEMFISLSRDEEIAAFVGSVLKEENESIKKKLIFALSKLNSEQWAMIDNIAQTLLDEMKDADP